MEGDSWYGRRMIEDAEGFPVADVQRIQECHSQDLLKNPIGCIYQIHSGGIFFAFFDRPFIWNSQAKSIHQRKIAQYLCLSFEFFPTDSLELNGSPERESSFMRLSGITGLFVKSEPGSVFLISIIIWEIFVSVKICVISVCGILRKTKE